MPLIALIGFEQKVTLARLRREGKEEPRSLACGARGRGVGYVQKGVIPMPPTRQRNLGLGFGQHTAKAKTEGI